jgi:hypothetical protein
MTQKFRPYFSAPELLEIISALKQSPTPNRLPIIQYLETFNIKIERGIVDSALTLQPPSLTLAQKIAGETTSTTDAHPGPENNEITKLTAYRLWLSSPTSCSPKQLSLVNTYRFENDLMSSAEEEEYIASLAINSGN